MDKLSRRHIPQNEIENVSKGNIVTDNSERNLGINGVKPNGLSEKGKALVGLIVKILVNKTLRRYYEEGDQISEI